MSSNGYRFMQLQQGKLEQLGNALRRRQARSLLRACKKQIEDLRDPIIQQLVSDKLGVIRRQIGQASANIDAAPDIAIMTIRSIQRNIQTILADAEVEAKRLRFEKMKSQARDLVTHSEDIIKAISDPATQQMIGPQVRQVQQKLQQVSQLISDDPGNASGQIKKIQEELTDLISATQKQAARLSVKQTEAQAALELARQNLQAQQETANESAKEIIDTAQARLASAAEFYRQAQYDQVIGLTKDISTLIQEIDQASFDETVRREAVAGLLSTLGSMGFVVDGPVLEGKDDRTGVVKLSGCLPSGKKASFTVNLEGKMEFDFDGYQGRTCAKDMETIEKRLNERFSIKLGEAQVTWKNPDRLAKGAMNIPSADSAGR